MWLFTTDGFYSVVQDTYDNTKVIVRARTKEDILRLAHKLGGEITVRHTPTADYEWRIHMSRILWGTYLGTALAEIDYPNFKNAVASKMEPGRAGLYQRVWATMLELQLSPTEVAAMHGD